ncbi:epoxyqueuosine reductase [candidate division WOR-3 bacterium]|nr:epoxyqueuosine reductase [candidate division WOR-3 bacterium]
MKQNLWTDLSGFAKSQGADLVGAAEVGKVYRERNLIAEELKNRLKYGIVCGIRLSSAVLSDISDQPTKTYYHHYRTVNMALDQLALKITGFLQERSFSAFPVPASQLIDWENQLGMLSHKHVAVEAGLGWIGRNNLLVTPQYGSQIRLVTVLTDAPFEVGAPLKEDCGSCRACLDVCPCNAIKDDPAAFDHKRCYAQLDKFVRSRVVGQHICGICVRVCSPDQVTRR